MTPKTFAAIYQALRSTKGRKSRIPELTDLPKDKRGQLRDAIGAFTDWFYDAVMPPSALPVAASADESAIDIALDGGAGATVDEIEDSEEGLRADREEHPDFAIPEITPQDEAIAIYLGVTSRLLELSELDRARFLKFVSKLYVFAQMPPQLCHMSLCLTAREQDKIMGPSKYGRKLSVTKAGPSRENLQHIERLRNRFRDDPEWQALLDDLIRYSGGVIAR